ncbi:MAG: DUF6387 family protein [Desulfomonilaceae bacterium]
MGKEPTPRGPNPPDWWKPSRYGFLKDLPLEGWVWEFMRRAKLKEMLKPKPVDAMNPRPNLRRGSSALIYYRRGRTALPVWQRFYDIPESAFTVKEAELRKAVLSAEFGSFPSEKDETFKHDYVHITIDLNRRDTVIKRDFAKLLKKLREEHTKKPPRTAFNRNDWVLNHVLEVWDLRQWGLSYPKIRQLLNIGDDFSHSPINALDTAKKYIDNGGWKNLALYCEAE